MTSMERYQRLLRELKEVEKEIGTLEPSPKRQSLSVSVQTLPEIQDIAAMKAAIPEAEEVC